jgi:methylated-DNA-[protein]-cysteine S-methyltransferase
MLLGLWDTPWGPMGAVRGPGGLLATVLPGGDRAAVAEALRSRHPHAERADRAFADLAGRVAGWFAHGREDFADLAVDLSGRPPFARRVLAELRRVGPGCTVTYAELAARCGSPGAARAVGAAMAGNPLPLIVPCHRVLAAGGRIGGFSAAGGPDLKRRMLGHERAAAPV